MNSSVLTQLDGKLLDGLHFCTKVYELFESIRATDEGRSRLRKRASDVEKKLIEELLPICKFASPADILITGDSLRMHTWRSHASCTQTTT